MEIKDVKEFLTRSCSNCATALWCIKVLEYGPKQEPCKEHAFNPDYIEKLYEKLNKEQKKKSEGIHYCKSLFRSNKR